MLRLFKPMLGEISFFFEKYFGADSLLWTILVTAFCFSLVSVAAAETAGLLQKKRPSLSVCSGVSAALAVPAGYLLSAPWTWNSKLQRVMTNFNYVLSFEANRKFFLEGLGLADNEANRKAMFRTALTISDGQWMKIIDRAEGSAWYFQKVYKAVHGILYIGNVSLSEKIIGQSLTAFIPAAALVILAVFLYRKKKILSGCSALICAVLSLFLSCGTAVLALETMFLNLALFTWIETCRAHISAKKDPPSAPPDIPQNAE